MKGKDGIVLPEDRRALERAVSALPGDAMHRDGGELLARLGLLFLGTPYAAASLEGKDGEPLVVDLRAFDCFTFVESMTALTLAIRAGEPSPAGFAEALERLRYRRGIRRGYASRLHYFTDWIGDNARLGILRDVTRDLGGRPDRKPVRYMTDHPAAYPLLGDRTVRAEVRRVERNLSRRRRYCLPPESIEEAEPLLREGDILGIASTAPGLDVVHAGLAVRREGRVCLLHASRLPAGSSSLRSPCSATWQTAGTPPASSSDG
jgi:hypothetical protein